MSVPDLSERTVFVTGASRGLGRALAQAFAGAGARLVLCARGEDDMARVAGALRDRTEVEWGAVDVSDEADVAALVARATERFGPVDALVNNASVLGPRVPLRDHPLDEWRHVLDVNLTGTLIPTLAVLKGMREAGRGSIINVSSGVGNKARARWGAYAISKWGVEALAQNLAVEEADAGIRVNIVDPGRLRTEMRRTAYPEEDPTDPTPPEDATGVFLWLASQESEGVTGERFHALDWSRP
ncbi:MAG: SDR family oxidoreductase [Longimicrobiales bacterium]|nr:SDR family oxidoreductase [Longimicrobiales bacterium]